MTISALRSLASSIGDALSPPSIAAISACSGIVYFFSCAHDPTLLNSLVIPGAVSLLIGKLPHEAAKVGAVAFLIGSIGPAYARVSDHMTRAAHLRGYPQPI